MNCCIEEIDQTRVFKYSIDFLLVRFCKIQFGLTDLNRPPIAVYGCLNEKSTDDNYLVIYTNILIFLCKLFLLGLPILRLVHFTLYLALKAYNRYQNISPNKRKQNLHSHEYIYQLL